MQKNEKVSIQKSPFASFRSYWYCLDLVFYVLLVVVLASIVLVITLILVFLISCP